MAAEETVGTEERELPENDTSQAPVYSWADGYAKKHGEEPTLAMLCAFLREPVDTNHLSSKQGVTYMNVTTIRNYLDRRLGPQRYEWETFHHAMAGQHHYAVVGRLTLIGYDGRLTKTGGGSEPLWDHTPYVKKAGQQQQDGSQKPGSFATKAFGDPFTNAEATALRRAAMGFGFCRFLWEKGGSR